MFDDPREVLRRAVAGERRWLARAITMLERRSPAMTEGLGELSVRRRSGPGAPHVIGLTGPPGAGKSTFADRIIAEARTRGERVAVVAVDPSSPFSGGAILGDRVRMDRHTGDDGVYIRSLSSGGSLGGLSISTASVVDLLDAAGYDTVLVETVGVGQSELGVMEVADTTVVVLTPESGDTVQTMKAGLLEIADVFVVNKADRPGADRLVRDLETSVMLDMGPAGDTRWAAPVLSASAIEGKGVVEVVDATRLHLAYCRGTGLEIWRKKRGDGRVRHYLDRVAEQARDAARRALDPATEAALRDGSISFQQVVR